MKKIMYIILTILVLISLTTVIILNQKQFGRLPSVERLERIKKSPNYKNGSFQNQSITPVMAEGKSYFKVASEVFFAKKVRVTPFDSIPSVKTDLLQLDKNKDILVWFGHSSYFMQVDGKRILVDPVLSGHASPFSFTVKAFKGTDRYTTDDIPDIDYLFISHDHWDHLDYETLMKLKPRIKKVICGLGVGEDFEYWGFDKNSIIELDWNEQSVIDKGFTVNALPARHFTGRGFKRNQTLWVSYLLQTPTMKIFIGGDGGYDKHFAEIGKKFGPIDLAILENGQYNENWKYIHLLPADLLKAFKDLNAKRLFPVHSSKFALSIHPWDEPLVKLSESAKQLDIRLVTPMIGQQVNLKDSTQKFTEWWKGIN
jgi:L-ascorbate metabolism protein UlaG (beta-lactamase superfamily)